MTGITERLRGDLNVMMKPGKAGKKWRFGGGVDQSTQTSLRRKRTGLKAHLKKIGYSGDVEGVIRQFENAYKVPQYPKKKRK